MSETYESILDKQWDDIQKPEVLPVGSWLLQGRNAVHQPAKSADGNERILFVYSVKEPMDDVDEDALEALGADYDYTENRVFASFWLETGRDLDAVRTHLRKHGVDTEGKTIKESLGAFKGTQVVSYLDHKTYDNAAGETVQDNNPTSFAALD